jgi:hypothetical protein
MVKLIETYPPETLVLKITLLYSVPKIWRRVEVPGGFTLHKLHYVIQCVFDWTDSHLYHFLVPPGGKLTRAARANAQRYQVLPPDPYFADDQPEDRPADEAIIGRIFTPECKQIIYEYDFGDSWEHLVKLEKRKPAGVRDAIPHCLAGENAAPMDDLGGVYGYYNWLDAFQDRSHESHQEAVEWLGADFDPVRFDLDRANKRLASAFKPAPKRSRKPRKKPE